MNTLTATEALLYLTQALALALADLDEPTPCQLDPDRWYGDDQAQRAQAADACLDCPVLQACDTYATAARERHGVWAGVDRSTTNATRRTAA